MPPPVHTGEREDPARARPVPFWRHGLEPPPDTWPRVLVDAVPCRRAFSSARTASCTTGMLNGDSNTTPSSCTVPPPSRGADRLAIAPHLHRAAAGSGNGAAHEQQVLPGDDLYDGEPALGDPAAAHPARPAQSLEDPRWRRRRADRAGGPDVVRPV